MLACYSMEFDARRDFFRERLLEDEKEKVKHINLDLEQRVQERTAQLKKTNEYLKKLVYMKSIHGFLESQVI